MSDGEKIRVTCDSCNTRIKVNPSLAGQQVQCPKCQAQLWVPNSEDEIEDIVVERVVPPLKKKSPTGSKSESKFCTQCGESISKLAEICPKCGVRQANVNSNSGDPGNRKLTAALLALLLGTLGAHWFYLGNSKKGFIYLLCVMPGMFLIVPPLIVALLSIVDGIRLLSMNSADFNDAYPPN